MDIRHLITFKKLSEYGSFTKTAESLSYTQSTITSHIQQLESELEVKLLERIGRKISLTSSGIELYESANELLRIYDKISEIKNGSELPKGHISIAAPESMMEGKIEPLLQKFFINYPGITVSVMNSTCSDSYQALIKGEVDLAFLFLPVYGNERLEVKKLSDEPLVLVSGKHGKYEHFSALVEGNTLNQCVILNEKECCYRMTFESKLMESNISCMAKMELWSIESIKRCVGKGMGISLLPLATVLKELESGFMKTIDTGETFKPIPFHLAFNRQRHCTRALEVFIETAISSLKE